MRGKYKPILWLAPLNNEHRVNKKTIKWELEKMESLESEGLFLTPRMGGCVASICGAEGIIAHFKHKEELIKYLYDLRGG